jgi:hypothetical protein
MPGSSSGSGSGSGSFSSSTAGDDDDELFSSSESDFLGHTKIGAAAETGQFEELDMFDSATVMEQAIEKEIQRQYMLQETLQMESSLNKYLTMIRGKKTNKPTSKAQAGPKDGDDDERESGKRRGRKRRRKGKKKWRRGDDDEGRGRCSALLNSLKTLMILLICLGILQTYIFHWFGVPDTHSQHTHTQMNRGKRNKLNGQGVPIMPSMSSLTIEEREQLRIKRNMRRNMFLDKIDAPEDQQRNTGHQNHNQDRIYHKKTKTKRKYYNDEL